MKKKENSKENKCKKNIEKNIEKNKEKNVVEVKTFFKEQRLNNKKMGAALTENILLIAISIVVIVSIFYPQLISLLRQVMQSLTSWFSMAINEIGVV